MKYLSYLLFSVILLNSCGVIIQVGPAINNGGRGEAIAMHPVNDNIFIVASTSGGLFKTINNGQTFDHLDNIIPNAFNDVKYLPSDPNVVIATASSDFTTVNGGGIWVSRDGGAHWSQPVSAVPVPSVRCTDRPGAHGISFSQGGSVIYAGTDCGIAVSEDGGLHWSHNIITGTPPAVVVNRNQDAVISVLGSRGDDVYACTTGKFSFSNNRGADWVEREPIPGSVLSAHALAKSPFNEHHLFIAFNQNTNSFLYSSVNAGMRWTRVEDAPSGIVRPPFTRTCKKLGQESTHFEVYYTNGKDMYKKLYRNDEGTGPVSESSWEGVPIGHTDPGDLAFNHAYNKPILSLNDGGIYGLANDGISLTKPLNGFLRYAALQLYEVKGQLNRETNEQDQYIGTQDNSVWVTWDDESWHQSTGIFPEGLHISTQREIAEASASRITVYNAGFNINYRTGHRLSSPVDWINPPSFADRHYSRHPYLVNSRHRVQATQISDDPADNKLFIKADDSEIWDFVTTIPYPLVQAVPTVSGDPENPSLFYAVFNPTGNVMKEGIAYARYELIRIDNIFGEPRITSIPNIGLGMYHHEFKYEAVYGVNPIDINHIIAPDMATDKMMVTHDGGLSWTPDETLTHLVKKAGANKFFKLPWREPRSPIHSNALTISFDPGNPNHILVGTAQSGIIRSRDGGSTWQLIDGSEKVAEVVSFFFGFENDIHVATWGRGLWKINTRRLRPPLRSVGPPPAFIAPPARSVKPPAAMDKEISPNPGDSIPQPKAGKPYILLSSNIGGHFPTIAVPGEKINLYGSLFKPLPGNTKLEVYLNDQLIIPDVKIDEKGNVTTSFNADFAPGYHIVKLVEKISEQPAQPVAYAHLFIPHTDKK